MYKLKDWLQEVKEARHKAGTHYEQVRRKFGRPRLKPPGRPKRAVLSNNRRTQEWTVAEMLGDSRYQLETLRQAVREEWGSDWNDEELKSPRILGEEGIIKEDFKDWKDGGRFVLIAQRRDDEDEIDMEQELEMGDPKSARQRFFKMSRWRRK
jgi:hypothetical protein